MQLNDWLTATLSVLTISLTILGVLIALIAVWGYRGIRDEAKSIADLAAKQQISSYLDSEAIQDKLKEEIRKRIEDEADKLFADLSIAVAYAPPSGPSGEPGVGQEPFAEEYPSDPQREP